MHDLNSFDKANRKLPSIQNESPKRFFKHHWETPDFGDGLNNNKVALISIDSIITYDFDIKCALLSSDEEVTIDDEEKERFEAWLESHGIA